MSEPRKHHYVPQFYQREFIADSSNRIWVYEKDRPPRRCGVKRTGMKIDLYAFRDKDGHTDFGSVERQLGVIDDQAAKTIQKLAIGKALTLKDRTRLSKFVSIMWRRTPKHMARVKNTARELLPKVLEPLDQMGDRLSPEARAELERIRKEYSENPPDFLFPQNVLRGSIFEDLMSKMDWAFFTASPGKEFLTCDDPARFSSGSGLGHKDATIAFPLSRRLLLQCKWASGWGNSFRVLTDEQVDYFNLWIVKGAERQVYASGRSEEIQLLVRSTHWDDGLNPKRRRQVRKSAASVLLAAAYLLVPVTERKRLRSRQRQAERRCVSVRRLGATLVCPDYHSKHRSLEQPLPRLPRFSRGPLCVLPHGHRFSTRDITRFMSTTTLIIIIIVVLLVGGGGWGYSRRGR